MMKIRVLYWMIGFIGTSVTICLNSVDSQSPLFVAW
jgi:hypothetical protein